MKRIEPGQLLQIIGNAGVILGIVLLVYELNQNQRMMQAQTRATVSQETADDLFRFSENEALSDLWSRGVDGGDLSEQEQRRFGLLLASRMRRQENVHYQYRLGLYDEEEFEAQLNGWRTMYSAPGAAAEFCIRRENYSHQFILAVEALLENRCE